MHHTAIKHLIILCLLWPSCLAPVKPHHSQQVTPHVIGCMPYGLFVNFGLVLSHLAWCVRNKAVPAVSWNQKCLYFTPDGYNGSHNAWEYYFQPVSSASAQGISAHNLYAAPDNSFISVAFDAHDQPTKAERRELYNTLIKPFIKLNPIVQAKVDAFFDEHMRGKHTIGIHLRGTDKFKDVAPVPPLRILEEAQRNARPDSQFFIATDEEKLLELAVATLPGNVITYDSYRSRDGNPLHHNGIYPAHVVGEQVVIEAWLLARCNLMVHSHKSNVSGAVLLLNPELDNILLTDS